MNQFQSLIQNAEIIDLCDYAEALSRHADYRVSGLAKAAANRLLELDFGTARQWLVWAAAKLDHA